MYLDESSTSRINDLLIDSHQGVEVTRSKVEGNLMKLSAEKIMIICFILTIIMLFSTYFLVNFPGESLFRVVSRILCKLI
jgi:hypothetical protein